jgi:uncharacterized cysteine cluster protein YcgN (CxxCxxCC family)
VPFWKDKTLSELSKQEWESLCDGCAKCCLVKLEDEDTGQVAYTNVVCKYMDMETCACTEYQKRNELVPHCVWLKPEMVDEFFWLPETCSYRLIAEGKDLPDWHHLISGDRELVHKTGNSVKSKVFSESNIHEDDLEEYIVHWVE